MNMDNDTSMKKFIMIAMVLGFSVAANVEAAADERPDRAARHAARDLKAGRDGGLVILEGKKAVKQDPKAKGVAAVAAVAAVVEPSRVDQLKAFVKAHKTGCIVGGSTAAAAIVVGVDLARGQKSLIRRAIAAAKRKASKDARTEAAA
jgi:hypothetical protein